MPAPAHPLEQFFNNEVTAAFESKLRLKDPEIAVYVARVLCEFSEHPTLFRPPARRGHTLDELVGMVRASDPIAGTAPSFDAERTMRKYIGDYSLFVAGMVPEAMNTGQDPRSGQPTLAELIRTGKDSYYVVSQFNVFEYRKESVLFERLADQFERYVLGLSLMREELGRRTALARRT